MAETSETPTDGGRSVEAWLRSLPPFAIRPVADWRVSPLPGLTNRVYLVRGEGTALVLRLARANSALALDREAELHNLGLAAGMGLAPFPLYMDIASGVLVTEFQEGSRPLENTDFDLPDMQEKVGATLRLLHSSKADFKGRQDPQSAIDLYLAKHPDRQAILLRRALGSALAALKHRAPASVPSHVDPNPSNFLIGRDGKLALVDWEFSALADPHWDVAAVLLSMPNDAAAARRLAAAVLGDSGDRTIARLRVFQAVMNLVVGSWAAMEAAQRGDGELVVLAREYLDRCRDMLAQGQIDAWVGELQRDGA